MSVDIAAVLTASITDFKAKMAEADVSMKTMTSSGSSTMSKMASIGKGALMGIAGGLAIVGVAAVDFGNKLEGSQASLQAALQAAGISWNAVAGSVTQTGNAATKYGFTQAQVDAALTQGVISTQSYSGAHRNLEVALQLAAARHLDLASAMQVVDKAAIGQTRALKMMGIDLPIVATSALKVKQAQDALSAAQLAALSILQQYPNALQAGTKGHAAYEAAVLKVAAAHNKLSQEQGAGTQILDALSKRLGGQASAAAATFEGRIAAAKAEGENLAARIGMVLIPKLIDLMNIIQNVITWFDKHKAVAEALGIAIGTTLVAAIGVFVGTTIAGMMAVDALLGGLPIIIGLIVTGVVLLATHWKQVWDDIKIWTHDAQVFIQQHFLLIMAIPIIGWILVLAANWRTVWDGIQTVMQAVWSVIGPVFNLIKTIGIDYITVNIIIMRDIWNAAWAIVSASVKAVWSVIGPIFGFIQANGLTPITVAIGILKAAWNDAWGAIAGAIEAAWVVISPIVNAVTAGINAVVAAKNFLAGSNANSSGAQQVNTIVGIGSGKAAGGPVSAMMPYLVGENGPEWVIPAAAGVVVPHGGSGTLTGGGGGGGGGGDLTVNFNLDGQTLYTRTFPAFLTVALQNKRSMVNLGLA